MADSLWIKKPHAQAYRVGSKQHVFMDESGLRIQRDTPFSALVQWRVKTKGGQPGSGIIAHASLSRSEIRKAIDYLTKIEAELRDDGNSVFAAAGAVLRDALSHEDM